MPVEIRQATVVDYDDLYEAFTRIANAGEGFPQKGPVARSEFNDYWIDHSAGVYVAKFGGYLIGASYIKANFVGRAAHIANAGYFVLAAYRGTGCGRALVDTRCARPGGWASMPCSSTSSSSRTRPAPCTTGSVSSKSDAFPMPSRVRTR